MPITVDFAKNGNARQHRRSVMGMTNILLGLIAYAAAIVAVVLAYAAGRLDGRRVAWQQRVARALAWAADSKMHAPPAVVPCCAA